MAARGGLMAVAMWNSSPHRANTSSKLFDVRQNKVLLGLQRKPLSLCESRRQKPLVSAAMLHFITRHHRLAGPSETTASLIS